MKKFIVFYGLMVVLLIIIGCSGTTQKNNHVYGKVIDGNGEAVSNARILISYYLEEITNHRPETTFAFGINEQNHVKLWITQHTKADTVRVLVDGELDSGYHSIAWNGRNDDGLRVLSNYYDWHLLVDDTKTTNKLFLNIPTFNSTGMDVYEYECLAVSDNNGDYKFEIAHLPFSFSDNSLEVYDETGEVIGLSEVIRYVKIWAIHEDFEPTCVDSIYIKKSSPTNCDMAFE